MSPARIVLACSCGVLSMMAADWPQYRGPNGDGSSPEAVRTNWLEQPPVEVWRRPIGAGFSSIAVSAGRLYTQARKATNTGDREVCLALDSATGNSLWETDVDAADYTDLSGYPNEMDGPRSTPTIDGNRVYVFTSHLKLISLDAATGMILWRRDFRAELGSDVIPWENAASPLIVGELIFVNSNARGRSLMAVRKSDGVTVWGEQDDTMTHATPVFATIGGVSQVIFLTRLGLVSVIPASGDVLWRLRFAPSTTSTAASPAVSGDYVYGSAAYGYGTSMAHVTRSGNSFNAAEAWYQRGVSYQAHWSTPVEQGGFLYCVPSPSSGQGRLACLDVAGGSNRWTQTKVGSDSMGYGSLIKAANALIVLTEGGELVLVKPNPDVYEELARFKALNAYCWNNATLANGRLYARSTSNSPELVALDVGTSANAPFPTQLSLIAVPSDDSQDSLVVSVRVPDGELTAAHLAELELIASTDIDLAPSVWSVLSQAFALENGAGIVQIPFGNETALFLSVRQKGSNALVSHRRPSATSRR